MSKPLKLTGRFTGHKSIKLAATENDAAVGERKNQLAFKETK